MYFIFKPFCVNSEIVNLISHITILYKRYALLRLSPVPNFNLNWVQILQHIPLLFATASFNDADFFVLFKNMPLFPVVYKTKVS